MFRTPRSGDKYTISREIVNVIKTKWRSELESVEAIGIATIGPIDIKRGSVVNTPNNPIRNFELIEPIVRELKRPVYVANDCVASVWGEKHYGDGGMYDNLVYLTLSTGVGAGVIVDGELLIGKDGNAHEIGHLVVDFNSDIRCGCGGRGHWEAYAGGANLHRVARVIMEKEPMLKDTELAMLLSRVDEVDAKTIFSYYRRGDELAKRVIDLFIKSTSAGLASLINAYDPELITIGGGVFLNNQDIILDPVVRFVKENIVTGLPIIKPTRLGEDIGLFGALALASKTPLKLKRIQDQVIERALSSHS